jgi:hypothetical protein
MWRGATKNSSSAQARQRGRHRLAKTACGAGFAGRRESGRGASGSEEKLRRAHLTAPLISQYQRAWRRNRRGIINKQACGTWADVYASIGGVAARRRGASRGIAWFAAADSSAGAGSSSAQQRRLSMTWRWRISREGECIMAAVAKKAWHLLGARTSLHICENPPGFGTGTAALVRGPREERRETGVAKRRMRAWT